MWRNILFMVLGSWFQFVFVSVWASFCLYRLKRKTIFLFLYQKFNSRFWGTHNKLAFKGGGGGGKVKGITIARAWDSLRFVRQFHSTFFFLFFFTPQPTRNYAIFDPSCLAAPADYFCTSVSRRLALNSTFPSPVFDLSSRTGQKNPGFVCSMMQRLQNFLIVR